MNEYKELEKITDLFIEKVKEEIKQINPLIEAKKFKQNVNGEERELIGFFMPENEENCTGVFIDQIHQIISEYNNLNDFYANEVNKLAKHILHFMNNEAVNNTLLDCCQDYSLARKMLVPNLVHATQGKYNLTSIPHKKISDLAVIYRVCKGYYSFVITDQIFSKWGISLEQLHKDAMENCQRRYPTKIDKLNNMLTDICIDGPYAEEVDNPLYVVTHEGGNYGAIAFFHEETIKKLLQICPTGGFYVIPSSQHELLILPTLEGIGYQRMKDIIHDINHSIVDKDDWLSDSLYFYRPALKKLEII